MLHLIKLSVSRLPSLTMMVQIPLKMLFEVFEEMELWIGLFLLIGPAESTRPFDGRLRPPVPAGGFMGSRTCPLVQTRLHRLELRLAVGEVLGGRHARTKGLHQ